MLSRLLAKTPGPTIPFVLPASFSDADDEVSDKALRDVIKVLQEVYKCAGAFAYIQSCFLVRPGLTTYECTIPVKLLKALSFLG